MNELEIFNNYRRSLSKIDTSDLDELIEKANKLNQILLEAKALEHEIASSDINLKIDFAQDASKENA